MTGTAGLFTETESLVTNDGIFDNIRSSNTADEPFAQICVFLDMSLPVLRPKSPKAKKLPCSHFFTTVFIH